MGGFLGPLLKTGFPLMKNFPKPLAKIFLTLLGLTVAVSLADAGIQKKKFELGTTMWVISKEQIVYWVIDKRYKWNNYKWIKITKRMCWYVIRYIRCYFIRKSVNK